MTRLLAVVALVAVAVPCPAQLDWIAVSKDGRGFVHAESGTPFVPWGNNYATNRRFIEDMWEADFDTIAADFREMKALGANVVRIHLQFGSFMEAADGPNKKSIEHFKRILQLADEVGIYLDVTGLASYRPADRPEWYDQLSQSERWRAQSNFWSAIAAAGAESPAIFCYDLMNEPVAAATQRKPGDWYSGHLLGGYDFVQYISLDRPDPSRAKVAAEWIATLTKAIRAHDKQHLITVGLLPSTKEWGHFSGFVPEVVAPEVDFISVHVYPKSGDADDAMNVTKQFAVGKPVVIEETFPLSCSAAELRTYLTNSRKYATGWMGHYEGQTLAELNELKKSGKITFPQAAMRDWLELFEALQHEMTGS